MTLTPATKNYEQIVYYQQHISTVFCGLSQFHRLALVVLKTTFSKNKSRAIKIQKFYIQFSMY